MEHGETPRVSPRMPAAALDSELEKIGAILERMADPDIFVWLGREEAATVITEYTTANADIRIRQPLISSSGGAHSSPLGILTLPSVSAFITSFSLMRLLRCSKKADNA